ncbi:NifU family protein [Hyphobacterium sp. CCMP332]|nr:NifU family protein [Hyphobacterium sp. CCMP332]
MEQIKKHIEVYTEANPNPNSLKFVANFLISPDNNSYDFESVHNTENSPLAKELFAHKFVERVFIMNNFVTVTKDETSEWADIIPKLKKTIKNYLESGEDVIRKSQNDANEIQDSDPEEVKKIKEILNEYIRPAVEMDGGSIQFSDYKDGVVKVELHGACSGCPSSTLTLKSGIENLLKRFMPQVKEVVAENK